MNDLPQSIRVFRPTEGDVGPGAHLLRALAGYGVARPIVGLAQAMVASPPARRMPDVRLAVRECPEPLLVFVGEPPTEARSALDHLPDILAQMSHRFRYIGWKEVEEAVDRLAEEMARELSPDFLAEAILMGIPRGGLVVAGLLAYALEIPSSRVKSWNPAALPSGPVVLVDDCVLTGFRLKEILGEISGADAPGPTTRSHLVVAPLFSHPSLRAAVEVAEPHVSRCLSGADLKDHGPRLLGDDYASWKADWAARVPIRYHTALLDLPAFPWNEPDARMWNEETETVDSNWWFAPPEICLQHRHVAGGMDLQVADELPGIEKLAPLVVPVKVDAEPDTNDRPAILLIHCGTLQSVTLRETGAELFRSWMEGDEDSSAREVAKHYEVEEERVRQDLDELLKGLASRAMLRKSE